MRQMIAEETGATTDSLFLRRIRGPGCGVFRPQGESLKRSARSIRQAVRSPSAGPRFFREAKRSFSSLRQPLTITTTQISCCSHFAQAKERLCSVEGSIRVLCRAAIFYICIKELYSL